MNPDYFDSNGHGVYILTKNGQEVGRWTNDIGLSLEAAAAKVAEILASFDPPVVTVIMPESVTQVKFRLAVLTLHGADTARLATAIDAVALALPVQNQEAARLRWIYTDQATRTDSVLIAVCGELGLNAAQIDAVFILAGTL